MASVYIVTTEPDGIQTDGPVSILTDPPDGVCVAVGEVTLCLAPEEQEALRSALA